jgi:cobalamin biosynthesis Mg chelatase CobN
MRLQGFSQARVLASREMVGFAPTTLRLVARALVAGLALAWAAGSPVPAFGAPCATALIQDWSDNGRIDRVYAPSCYPAAIAALPEDVRAYGTAAEDIERALRDRARMLEAERAAATKPRNASPARSLSSVKPAAKKIAAKPKATPAPKSQPASTTPTPSGSDLDSATPEVATPAAAETTDTARGPWIAAGVGVLLLLVGAGWATIRRIRAG